MSTTKSVASICLSVLAIVLAGCGPEKNPSQPSQHATAPALPTPTPAPTPKPTPVATPTPDAATLLIQQVEAEYQAGRENYTNGHLDAAKKNFDNAVNLMLDSNLDIKGNPQLAAEFDKVSSGVNDLEMLSLKQGDGFAEQNMRPAPIDVPNSLTFPVDPNLKAQAEAELKKTQSDLPLVINDAVAGYINYYSKGGRGTLANALRREGLYKPMIQRVFREEGVPQDLIYIAIVESGFQPLALSRAGARGMWQFMPFDRYGLTRNWWVEERQDPEKSTRAAARFLKELYNEFGDWYLAIAAYNSGPITIQAAVERTGYADFWELHKRGVLPKETQNYVPIILAAAIIAKNPEQYGLQDLQPDLPLEVDKVTVDYPVDLRLAAECIDTPVETIIDLNPSLLRMTTPRQGSFDLNLPAGTKDMFLQNIAAIPMDKRVSWRYHKVVAGDTLESLATRYTTSVKAITQVNNLNANGVLQADSRIIIPVTPAAGGYADGYSRHPSHYKVRKGDTVLSVADDLEVAPEQLRKWNHLRGNSLPPGRVLIVYRPEPGGEVIASHARQRRPSRVRHSRHKGHSSGSGSTKHTKSTAKHPAGSTTATR